MGSGFRTFQSGEVLTASNVQNFLMDQSVMVFAGTAARGSAIASPETGMVSYRTDGTADSKREGFEFYDGASWTRLVPAPSSGLVYLTGATFTTVTSVSLPTNTFTSTYRNYRFILSLTGLTSDADFTLRFRASGTDDASNAYQLAMNDIRTTGTSALATANTGTSMSLAEQDTALPERYRIVLDVLSPQLAVPTTLFGFIQFVDKAATYTASRTGSGFFGNSTSFDSLSFISSVASSISGNYRVYGYADS